MAPEPKQRSRWRPSRNQLLVVAGIVAAVVVIVALYWISWSGFDAYTPIKSGDVEVQREKTLWDWLGLLIIPLVLVIGGYWFNRSEREQTQRIADQRASQERRRAAKRATIEQRLADFRAKNDRKIAEDRLRDAALQEYLDRMAELLLAHNLGASEEGEPVRFVARARTLTVLRALDCDGIRKGSVVQYLHEAGLIKTPNPIVSLDKADLSNANLHGADLSNAHLYGANLIGANLSEASFHLAKLDGANLTGADLTYALMRDASLYGIILKTSVLIGTVLNGADLQEADLREAIMSHAKLIRADLSGAHLNNANLSWANLSGAKLDRAALIRVDLSHADLTNSTATPQQLDHAKSLKGASMPDGSKHD